MGGFDKENPESIKVWTRFRPVSTDPIRYDLAEHHITMRSVLASLVSKYKNGEIAPQIAKRWETDDLKTQWVMTLDQDWTFDNNEKVSPEIVVASIKRILLLKNKQKSKSGLLEYLLEADKLQKINDNIEGLQVQKNAVVFKFDRSMPDFLEKISFGIYAIVHPSDYDVDGNWLHDKSVVASSAYRISGWSENDFSLSLRDNLYINKNTKRIRRIDFIFSKKAEDINTSDIIIREKLSPSIESDKWTYESVTQDNNITYVKVMKWKDKTSVFSSVENRKKLRNIFYNSLKEAGVKPTTSFFPLSISGVSSFEYDLKNTFDFQGKDFFSQPYFTSEKKNELGDIFSNAFEIFGKKINAVTRTIDYPEKESDEEKIFDIQFLSTGIEIDYPWDDIKFMFLSKQGIRLPDETGEILRTLENNVYDVQTVNKYLWDQAIIWPIRHHSLGFWTKKTSGISVEDLNLTMHPIDFQFLKWK